MVKIYALTDCEGNKRYVGQTKQSLYKRKKNHRDGSLSKLEFSKKDNWIRKEYKAGRNIEIELLEECNDSVANEREQYWIDYLKPTGLITNTQRVGNRRYVGGQKKWSDEEKAEIKRKAKNYPHNIVTRKAVLQYDLNGNFIGEHESIGSALTSLGKSDGHTYGIIKVCNGEYGQAYGFIWRYKINDYKLEIGKFVDPRWKIIEQYSIDGVLVATHNKIREAIAETGISRTHIGRCLNGESKSAKGFIWKYKSASQKI